MLCLVYQCWSVQLAQMRFADSLRLRCPVELPLLDGGVFAVCRFDANPALSPAHCDVVKCFHWLLLAELVLPDRQ